LRELGPICNRELLLPVCSPLDKRVWALAGDAVARKGEMNESAWQ